MARAMARGWGEPVLCSDAGSGRAAALAAELGGRAASNTEVAEDSDLVVLCHKPAQLDEVAEEIRGHVAAVASVLALVTTDALRIAYLDRPVFRLMPNTPVGVRSGIICYSRTADVDAAIERDVLASLRRLGSVVNVPEPMIDLAGAVMGVGPAYLALAAEAQVDAAIRYGLPAGLAARLMAETMAGTAALLAAHDYDTLAVRREVTSPGGLTARGLDGLERGGIRSAFQLAADRLFSAQ